jgi:hypothetical protein
MKSAHMNISRYIFTGLLLLLTGLVQSQFKDLQYSVELTGTSATGQFTPFWLQSNQFGKIPQYPNSIICNLELFKPLLFPDKKFEIAYGIEVNSGLSQSGKTILNLQQAYLDGKWLIFDLSIGMKERDNLITDSSISTGDLLISSNSRPIPQIRAGIEEFTPVPLTKGMLEFRGALAHGWFADQVLAPGIMFHHKYLHLRLGGKLPVRLQYGIEHVAEWGGNIPGNGDQSFTLNRFKNIFLGRSGDESSSNIEQANALGNHIISTHLKLEGNLGDFRGNIYWINMLEDNPVRLFPWLTMNSSDGLWGFNLRNNKMPFVQGFVYEYMNTLDNSGPWHDKDGIIYGGLDTYFRNIIYKNGWTHFGRTIGNPLILSPVYNSDGNISITYNYVRAHHLGLDGNISGFSYRILTTFSQYFINNLNPPHSNVSWMFEVSKKFEKIWNMEFSLKAGGDTGDLPGKTTGFSLSVRKTGILFQQ